MSAHGKSPFAWITDYSLPLIVGVFAALAAANTNYEWYHHLIDHPLVGFQLLGHDLNLHYLINDVFMVFFFGVATKEITDAVLPGGALNPVGKAINPLLGTVGGIVGPVGVFLGMTYLLYADPAQADVVAGGFGIPTATDIALAWLVARLVFGARHPAVSFLLLLAIADDAAGLGIIAIFYPDPNNPVAPIYLLVTAGGMAIALLLRRLDVRRWWPYVFVAGSVSWLGLSLAHLHPALALVFIVPFMPKTLPDTGLIPESSRGDIRRSDLPSPLDDFEHTVKPPVDWGLFLFAFCNAGVAFDVVGRVTWIVLASLVVGKTLGITLFSWFGTLVGFPLPQGMDFRALVTAGLVAGLGLTVALFVAGVAYTDPLMQGEAKMGALFSGSVFVLALLVGRMLGIRPQPEDDPAATHAGEGDSSPANAPS